MFSELQPYFENVIFCYLSRTSLVAILICSPLSQMFLKHSSSVKKVAGKIKQHRIKDKSTSVYERNYTATEMNQQKFKAWGFTKSSVFWERSS